MKTRIALAVTLTLLLGTAGTAQVFISATVTPSPVAPGASVTGGVEATVATYLTTGTPVPPGRQGRAERVRRRFGVSSGDHCVLL